jgi:acetyl-CoA C-acetyltransferase
MTEVIVAGVGQTDVGEHWDVSLRELALHAIEAAVRDAGGIRPQALYVANMLAPSLSGQSQLATLIADFAGLTGIEAVSVEAAGASGGAALRAGYLAVLSRQVDAVLVVGVEKVTDTVGSKVEHALSTVLDADYEAEHGLTLTAQAALLMGRYLHETGAPREGFAGFPVTAHANGAGNPHAMFRKAIKPETYARAGIVNPPLNLFDAAPVADGAAAVLLTREGILAERHDGARVRISGSSVVTDTLALHDRPDPLDFRAVRASVEAACRQAGVMPGDVDLFEVFDAFSIYAALSLEAAGFAEKGQGWALAQNGGISLKGKLPLMTFGGLKARGNPGGATGVYQTVEAVLQLRGEAGAVQVPEARRALIQCLGGPASTVATHVLERI